MSGDKKLQWPVLPAPDKGEVQDLPWKAVLSLDKTIMLVSAKGNPIEENSAVYVYERSTPEASWQLFYKLQQNPSPIIKKWNVKTNKWSRNDLNILSKDEFDRLSKDIFDRPIKANGFGASLAISVDETTMTLIVGAPKASIDKISAVGAVYLYTHYATIDGWKAHKPVTNTIDLDDILEEENQIFGDRVSVGKTEKGSEVLITAPGALDGGCAYLFPINDILNNDIFDHPHHGDGQRVAIDYQFPNPMN